MALTSAVSFLEEDDDLELASESEEELEEVSESVSDSMSLAAGLNAARPGGNSSKGASFEVSCRSGSGTLAPRACGVSGAHPRADALQDFQLPP